MSFSISRLATLWAGVVLAFGTATSAMAQSAPLSAQDSDPSVMGWMQGFPPPPDKLITQPDSNYFSFPKLRWSVCHLREFLPTEEISRGTRRAGAARLPVARRVRGHAQARSMRSPSCR